jgi:polynucleotide 5'-kinase involved in rRNA processing
VYVETTGDEAVIVSTGRLAGSRKVAEYLHIDTIYSFMSSDFNGALVGLQSDNGKLQALGIIDDIDFPAGTISIFSTARKFSVLQFGSIRLDRPDFCYAGAFGPVTLRP